MFRGERLREVFPESAKQAALGRRPGGQGCRVRWLGLRMISGSFRLRPSRRGGLGWHCCRGNGRRLRSRPANGCLRARGRGQRRRRRQKHNGYPTSGRPSPHQTLDGRTQEVRNVLPPPVKPPQSPRERGYHRYRSLQRRKPGARAARRSCRQTCRGSYHPAAQLSRRKRVCARRYRRFQSSRLTVTTITAMATVDASSRSKSPASVAWLMVAPSPVVASTRP